VATLPAVATETGKSGERSAWRKLSRIAAATGATVAPSGELD